MNKKLLDQLLTFRKTLFIKLHVKSQRLNVSEGYIAIASMLVITAVVLVIGTTVSLTAINGAQGSLAYKKSEESLFLAESCAEEVLLKIYNDEQIPSQINLLEGNCSVSLDSQTGNNYQFSVEMNFENYVKRISVEANRGNEIEIVKWEEI